MWPTQAPQSEYWKYHPPWQCRVRLFSGRDSLPWGASVSVSPSPTDFSEKSIPTALSKVENLETQGHCQEGVWHSHT